MNKNSKYFNPKAIESCPFCGQPVYLEMKPLWRTYRDGTTHGYYGDYEADICCRDPECGCRINLGNNTTLYQSKEKAIQTAIEHWNRRPKKN